MKATRVALAVALALAVAHDAAGQTPAPVINVLSTGTGPKRAVRYRAAAGAKDRIEVAMKMSITMDLPEAGSQAIDAPPVRLALDVDVDDVAANGDITSRMEIVSASMEGPGLPAGLLDSMKGLSGAMVMTDRGLVKSMTFDAGKAVDPNLGKILSSMGFDRLATPMPAEPLGVGAKWEVVQTISANGMETLQKSAYELVAMDAASMTFDVTVEQSAAPQTMALPGTAMEASLVSMTGQGSGRMTLPDGALALFGEMTVASKVVMDIIADGVSQRMSTVTGMTMSIARGER